MNRQRMVLLFTLFILFIGGCGFEKEFKTDESGVSVNKKGVITQAIVEDFSQPYYDADELKKEIEEKIASYNQKAANDEAIVLDRYELSEEKILSVYLRYQTSKDYDSFNGKEFYVGSVQKAYENGNDFDHMQGTDGQAVSAHEILENGDYGVVILEESQKVFVPTKIAYVSQGVSVIDEKTALNLNEGETAYIVYTKK